MEASVDQVGREESKNVFCGCGNKLHLGSITVQWSDKGTGRLFTIRAVPILQCKHEGCRDFFYPGDVELTLSLLAEDMELGILAEEIEYEERL